MANSFGRTRYRRPVEVRNVSAKTVRLTGAQTIELSAGTTDYTSIVGDGPALVLLRG